MMNDETVTKLLSSITRMKEMHRMSVIYDIAQPCFNHLDLISANGVRFSLSIQGGYGIYSSPKKNLPRITDYDSVEIGIIPAKGNHWLKPSEVGLDIPDNTNDDIIRYFNVKELITALVKFFKSGGSKDYSEMN